MKEKEEGAAAVQDVSVEGLRDDVEAMDLGKSEEMEEEEGGVMLGERFEGCESPVMMPPAGALALPLRFRLHRPE